MIRLEKKIPFLFSKLYKYVFFIFLSVCLLITVLSLQYYKSLSSTIRMESEQYLQEISRRIGENIDRIVSDNYDILHTLAVSLEYSGYSTFEDAKGLLQKQKEFLNYENLLLIDVNGTAYNLSSAQTFVSFDETVRKGLLSGQNTMSTTQLINNTEYILFSVPLHNISIDGKSMVALAASYAPSSFDQVLSMTSFSNQAYSQIVTTTGTVVVRSSSPYAFKSGYNIFSTMEDASIIRGKSLSQVIHDLSLDASGQISFSLDGKDTYMVYAPLSPQGWHLLSFVPADVVNEKSNLLLRTTLLICGLITVTFAGLCAAIVYIFSNHKRSLEQIAYVDDVTGGNTIKRFYTLAQALIASRPNICYALIYTNIIKFKMLNDELGRVNCDKILRIFSEYISRSISKEECIGRLSADNFCILLEFSSETELLEKFGFWHMDASRMILDQKMTWTWPAMEFGIYVIENKTLTFPQMIDRAKLALRASSRAVDGKLSCAFYDDAVRRRLLRERQLEDRMEKALECGEFKVFLQPKYHLPEEVIGGAEALVRWQSTEEGMIYPDEFIPLFEKNGFIIKLDLFVFETVCRTLRRWMDGGLSPVRISVNCSRLHFKDPAFISDYTRIADKYRLNHSFIEIEVTESMILENSEFLIQIIHNIKDAGFECSMDDFGSGYSSLNLIQTIPVDVLKLDKIFFCGSLVELQRTEAVVTNIVSLAKALSMKTVAEGVEERAHVEMLKRAGCDYIQGYVFAKPMEITAFEELTFSPAHKGGNHEI